MRDPYYIGSYSKRQDKLSMSVSDSEIGGFTVFAHGGSGILISRALAKMLVKELNAKRNLANFYYSCPSETCCGDVALGFMIQELTNREVKLNNVPPYKTLPDPFQGEILQSTAVEFQEICGHVASFHHLSPESSQKLYDWESDLVDRKPNVERGILYGDFYNDFVLPYVVEERSFWNNYAQSSEYTTNDGEKQFGQVKLSPDKSKDDRKKACFAKADCYMWKYHTDGKKCSLSSNSVAVGISTRSKTAEKDKNIISGWCINKIRKLRASENCDFLKVPNDEYTDSPDLKEGWYFRAEGRNPN